MLPSATLLPITSHLIETPLFRMPLKASKGNALKACEKWLAPNRGVLKAHSSSSICRESSHLSPG
jgi:hypothetical protein